MSDTKLDLTKRLEKATEECREAVREAHQVMRDLKVTQKEINELVQTALDDAKKIYAEQVKNQCEILSKEMGQAIVVNVEKINRRFTALEKSLFAPLKDGDMTAEDIAKLQGILRKIPESLAARNLPNKLAPMVYNKPTIP